MKILQLDGSLGPVNVGLKKTHVQLLFEMKKNVAGQETVS